MDTGAIEKAIARHRRVVEADLEMSQANADEAMNERFEGFGGTDLQRPLSPQALLMWHYWNARAAMDAAHIALIDEFERGKHVLRAAPVPKA